MFGNKEQNQYVVLDYNIDLVQNAVIQAATTIGRFSVSYDDRMNRKVGISVNISAFTWGEHMEVYLQQNSPTQTQLYVTSDSNLGTEIAGKKQNRKNIDELIQGVYSILGSMQVTTQNPVFNPAVLNQAPVDQNYQHQPMNNMQQQIQEPMMQQQVPQQMMEQQPMAEQPMNNMQQQVQEPMMQQNYQQPMQQYPQPDTYQKPTGMVDYSHEPAKQTNTYSSDQFTTQSASNNNDPMQQFFQQ